MIVSTGEEAPVEEARVDLGRPLRVALFSGRGDDSRRLVARVALAAAAEPWAVVPADDPRSFVDVAQALREAAPEVVLLHAASRRDAAWLTTLIEALRLGCAAQRPVPRIVALGDPRAIELIRPAAGPFAVETPPGEAEVVRALRDDRRAGDITLRDEVIERAARSLVSSSATDALAVDVSERSTSIVLARRDGRLEAVHVVPLGLGEAADRVVARAGIDHVRRWLTWPIDAPALLERVFNRARWPGALPAAAAALALEMALAREAIAHALRDAEFAGLDVAAMRAAPSILITGRAASFPRASQSLLTLVDGLEPAGVATVFREPDEGGAERIAMLVALSPRRSATLRFVTIAGRSEERVTRGSFSVLQMNGDVNVRASGADLRGHGHAGTLGVLIDARGRPLALPLRDAERIPVVSRWHTALGMTVGGRA